MLSYIRLQNFRCFSDAMVDFRGKKKKPKRMVFMYGENGSGKSNLINAMQAVLYSLQTITNLEVLDRLNQELEEMDNEPENDSKAIPFRDFLKGFFFNLKQLVADNKSMGSEGNLSIEIGFYLEAKEGFYRMELDDDGVVAETLEYQINNRRGTVFSLSEGKVILSPTVFFDITYNEELRSLLQQYWGKHTFLSIMMNEFRSKNEEYLKDHIGQSFLTFFNWISEVWLSSKSSAFERQRMGSDRSVMLRELDKGTIKAKEMSVLEATEDALNSFFLPLYSDLKRVFYKKEIRNSKVEYALYVTKLIDDKKVDIAFREESTGTQRLLKLFPFIMGTVSGNTVLVDEIDTGIHDVLVKEIVGHLYETLGDNDKGQIIATTHNTLLMDELPSESVFIISVDLHGNRSITPVEKYEFRTHANNSVRSKYFSGDYSGVPITGYLNFSDIVDTFSASARPEQDGAEVNPVLKG